MKKGLIVIAAIAALVWTPALAADMAPSPSVVAPTYSWTGFYVGGNAGYAWNADPTVSFSPNDSLLATKFGPGAPISFGVSGAVGGFQLGYNWQFKPTWLVGFETDFDFSGAKGSGTSTNIVVTPGPGGLLSLPFASTANEQVKSFGTVRARLGYLAADNILIYGTGGFAYGRVTQSANYINNSAVGFFDPNGGCNAGTTCYSGTSPDTAIGWTAGAGLEYALLNHWTIRAEYLHVDLGGNTFNENVLAPGAPPGKSSSFAVHFNDVAFHIVRGGLNYRF